LDVDSEEEDEMHDVHHFDQNGFGVARKSIASAGLETEEEASNQNADGNNIKEIQDERMEETDDDEKDTVISITKDSSSASERGVWLGVLSSTVSLTLVRLVPSRDVGAVYVDEYNIDATNI
jgi:hypothetical protein